MTVRVSNEALDKLAKLAELYPNVLRNLIYDLGDTRAALQIELDRVRRIKEVCIQQGVMFSSSEPMDQTIERALQERSTYQGGM